MFKIFKTDSLKEKYAKKEINSSDFIPYKCHWNKNTILTKSNELMQVIKIEGFSFETADQMDIESKKNMRNQLFKNLSSGNIILYFHMIRVKKPLEDSGLIDEPIFFERPKDFVSYLSSEWRRKYSEFESFFNELYITIIYRPDKAGAAFFEYIYKKLRQRSEKNQWKKDMAEMTENITEMSNRILNTFRDYDPKILSVENTKDGAKCEILNFLGKIVNCATDSDMLVPSGNIDKYICNNRLFFGRRSIEARGPRGSKYAGIVTIKEYGPSTYAGIFDVFLQLPFELIITQSFSFANRTVAINEMQLQQNRMIQAEDKAVSQIEEISQALDMAMSGDIGFGQHHMTVLCIDDNLSSLENTISTVAVEISNCGMQSVRETVNLEASFWGQLPGNSNYLVRLSKINTLNLAGFVSMHNYPLGKIRGNHWGNYLTIMETTSGTPYFFNFHVRDVGHTLIIGPTGAGKTVLMNFLCANAQKYGCRMYFFDKDRGAEIFIRALGGIYSAIDPGSKCDINPLQLPDTSENRTFLLEWLRVLVTTNGEVLTSEDIKVLNQAIEGNYRLNKRDRRLKNIAPFLGMETSGSLASRLSMWHSNGSHSKVFDNENDNIDLTVSKNFGFEMAQLLGDPVSMSPVLLYIFHRINISLDGSPTMIVLDEAWALIDNPIFAPKIKDWLKVLRKLNTFVIFATQSVEDASKSQISDTLIQQTATQIFLPNLKATDVYKDAFMLSEREYQIVKTTDPSSRYFLVKQGVNSVVARVDLSGMDDIINVLSGRTETVLLVESLYQKYGNNPEEWLDEFYEKVSRMRN